MGRKVEGKLGWSGRKIALVIGRFNSFVSAKLKDGAIDCLTRHGVAEADIDEVWVPGAYEIPFVAKTVAATGRYDAVLCLGAVIRGDTPHFDYVAAECARGVSRAAYDTGVPVVFGVLTTDTLEQAVERAGAKAGNKGWDAGVAALELVSLLDALRES